jgi:hypothetical protein
MRPDEQAAPQRPARQPNGSRTNCLVWAVLLLLRRRRKGHKGYLGWRVSWTIVGHVLYIERRHYGLRMISYKPVNPEKQLLPPPLFTGYTDWGDLDPPAASDADDTTT